jgi:hypothetical protein
MDDAHFNELLHHKIEHTKIKYWLHLKASDKTIPQMQGRCFKAWKFV